MLTVTCRAMLLISAAVNLGICTGLTANTGCKCTIAAVVAPKITASSGVNLMGNPSL